MVALVALADQVQHPVAAQQRLGVVLDPHGRCFVRAESVDAEQIGESPVVDADGLGDFEEPDQREPVQPLGAGLVGMDLRKSCIHGGIRHGEAVGVAPG